jgi:hypothetical protein
MHRQARARSSSEVPAGWWCRKRGPFDLATIVVVIVAWFAILFTVRYPRGIFRFVEGVMRWHNRVTAYAFVVGTDRYPPFGLAP